MCSGLHFALPVVGNFDPPTLPVNTEGEGGEEAQESEGWNAMYDLDDDGRIGFGDLAHFVPSFLQNVDESDDGTVAAADFDQSGRVDFADFALFVSNFGRREDDGLGELVYAPGVSAPLTAESVSGDSSMAAQQAAQSPGDDATAPIVISAEGRMAPALREETVASVPADATVEVVDLTAESFGEDVTPPIHVDVGAGSFGWFIDTVPGERPAISPQNGREELFAQADDQSNRGLDLFSALISAQRNRLDDASKSEHVWIGIRRWLDEAEEAEGLLQEQSFDTKVVDELFAEIGS